MRIHLIERPSPLAAVCAPTSLNWLPTHGYAVDVAVERALLSQALQVSTQAEMARVRAAAGGSSTTNGFLGSKGATPVAKRMTDGANGVPPRGRPV